jgi:tetratricopeptide (TPR) repeat protein
MRRWTILAFCISLLWGAASIAVAEDQHECDRPESDRRIKACTELIETPGIPPTRQAMAYANRALSYSLMGEYQAAIRDYDQAIGMFPDFAVALNNRAWAYFKWGRATEGMTDVQRALQIDPQSPHALDTRAHIHQSLGDQGFAMRDYEAAMMFGGTRMVTLYQCGLKMHKLYDGPNDGVIRPALLQAMRLCIEKGGTCDPLPPDEECREAVA